jgi:hypothetical protein
MHKKYEKFYSRISSNISQQLNLALSQLKGFINDVEISMGNKYLYKIFKAKKYYNCSNWKHLMPKIKYTYIYILNLCKKV